MFLQCTHPILPKLYFLCASQHQVLTVTATHAKTCRTPGRRMWLALTPKRWVTPVPAAVSRTTENIYPCGLSESELGLWFKGFQKKNCHIFFLNIFFFLLFSMFWTSSEAPCVTSLRYHSSERAVPPQSLKFLTTCSIPQVPLYG